jgi:hypothetical protein
MLGPGYSGRDLFAIWVMVVKLDDAFTTLVAILIMKRESPDCRAKFGRKAWKRREHVEFRLYEWTI